MDKGLGSAGLRPLGIGEILDVSIKLYRKDFLNLLKAVALVTVPMQVLSVLLLESATLDLEEAERVDVFGNTTYDIDGGDIGAFFAAITLSVLLGLVAGQLASGACFKMIAGRYLDEELSWRDSLRFALSRLGPMTWLTLLSGFLTFLAALACIVPGIYFYVAWSVAIPILLLEDLRGRAALKRSRFLVKDQWWSVFGVVLLSGVLAAVVGGVLAAALTLPFELAFESDLLVTITSNTGAVLAGVLTTPFSAAVIIVLYVDLRVRREGFDLELLARNIGVTAPVGGLPQDIFGRPGHTASQLPPPPSRPGAPSSSLPPPPPPPSAGPWSAPGDPPQD